MPPFYDHHHDPFVMPYDFGHSAFSPAHGKELTDIYPISISHLNGHHHAGHLGAESSLNAVIDQNSVAQQHQGSQQAQQQQIQSVAPIKANNREDVYYPGKQHFICSINHSYAAY